MPTYVNRSADGQRPKGPSKKEVKRRVKEEEKVRKAAEKAAKQAELNAQLGAAVDLELVRAPSSRHDKLSCTHNPSPHLLCWLV